MRRQPSLELLALPVLLTFGAFGYSGDGGNLTCAPLKCAESSACGEAMPKGASRLTDAEISATRRWIAQGAKND